MNLIKKTIRKHKEDADIVFWTYNWGYVDEEHRIELLKNIPNDVSLLVTFEMFEKIPTDGVMSTCVDYTLSFEGPGKYFASEAKIAKERGIRLYTMCNTGGLTWDIGVIPYEPCPYSGCVVMKNCMRRVSIGTFGLDGISSLRLLAFFFQAVNGLLDGITRGR